MQVKQQDSENTAASKVPAERADEQLRELIARVRVGDHQAFEVLFDRYLGPVYRQAMRLLAD